MELTIIRSHTVLSNVLMVVYADHEASFKVNTCSFQTLARKLQKRIPGREQNVASL
jgi:hypothetical protein